MEKKNMTKYDFMDVYEIWELCHQIRSVIDTLQAYTQDTDKELSRDTIYYSLETIRLNTDAIETISEQPLEDRLKMSELKRLASKLHLNEVQLQTLISKEDGKASCK